MIASPTDLMKWPTRLAKSRVLCSISVPGTPVSKGRHRYNIGRNGRVRVYTPDATATAEEAMGWQFKAATNLLEPDGESAFGVRAAFYNPTLQRRDLDNLLKLVCDAANGVLWKDDAQVIEIHANLVRGCEEGRSDIVIYRIGMITTRKIKCPQCAREFNTYPSWRYKRWCSRRCWIKGNATGTMIACSTCGTTEYRAPHRILGSNKHFCSIVCRDQGRSRITTCPQCKRVFRIATTRRAAKNEFCTRECAIAFFRAAPLSRVSGHCVRCGAGVARKNHLHCRACKIEMNPNPTSNYWVRTPAPI